MKATGYKAGVPYQIELECVDDRGHLLTAETAEAWRRMRDAALKDGIKLWLNGAWRSYQHQAELWDLWNAGKFPSRPSRPGMSEHHTGEAVDINRSHDDPDGAGPQHGPTDDWLAQNAAKYGFKRTVPGELWHFRFSSEWVE